MRRPTHVHCFECGEYTEIQPDDDPVELACWNCTQLGDDGWVTEPVLIFPCPGGAIYENDYDLCDDENHDWRTGTHVLAFDGF